MWLWGWARPAPQGRRGLGAKVRRSSPAEPPVSPLRVPFFARPAVGGLVPSVRMADRILVPAGGKVEARSGRYRELFKWQAAGYRYSGHACSGRACACLPTDGSRRLQVRTRRRRDIPIADAKPSDRRRRKVFAEDARFRRYSISLGAIGTSNESAASAASTEANNGTMTNW